MNSHTNSLSFSVIPVIDLMGGQVVHARRGERDRYQPIASALCTGSDPLTIAGALLQRAPFTTLYIADLDAIKGSGHHVETVARLLQQFPGVEFWIDGGFADSAALQPWLDLGASCVIGSESQHSEQHAAALLGELGRERAILSLDFRNGEFLGPQGILKNPETWPERLIAMNLAQVGSDAGPDLGLLESLQKNAPTARIYAAGGVRHMDDLITLKTQGAAGALVASALHSGRMTAENLKVF